MKKTIIWILSIIVFSNLPYVTNLIGVVVDDGHYRYSNSDGSSTFLQFADHTFALAKERHRRCNIVRPKDADTKLYRLFSKDPLAFWRWGLYFYDERYKLPYKDWKMIEKNRRVVVVDGCSQSF